MWALAINPKTVQSAGDKTPLQSCDGCVDKFADSCDVVLVPDNSVYDSDRFIYTEVLGRMPQIYQVKTRHNAFNSRNYNLFHGGSLKASNEKKKTVPVTPIKAVISIRFPTNAYILFNRSLKKGRD